MNEMPMGGSSTHAWFAAPAAFIGMWMMMMVPMMLPSLIPALWRYRRTAVAARRTRTGRATGLVGVGYFFVWTVFGAAAFPLSVALTQLAPVATGVIAVIAGAWQFTKWKAHHLADCRQPSADDAHTALRYGVRLGLECARSCGNLMVISLVFGTMDLPAMAFVATAITLERVLPSGVRAARVVGVAALMTGIFLSLGSLSANR
jgi:predicted metal-binding membrane protein